MLSQKLLSNSILFLLMVVDVVLSALLLKRPPSNVEEILNIQKLTFQECFIDNATITSSLIYKELQNIKDNDETIDWHNAVLIPPYPCGACVSEQEDIILESLGSLGHDTVIFVPEEWYVDVRARLSSIEGITIRSYTKEKVISDSLKEYDGVVYVRIEANTMDVFASSKMFPEASAYFLENAATE